LNSPTVMRYLGRRDISYGHAPREIMTDCRRFYEGVRIKHWRNDNSVKMYNKSGSILRIETIINYSRDFKVFRKPEDDKNKPASWLPMRKGVSDLHRRCEVSHQCNTRYADALAASQIQEKLKELATGACNKTVKEGKRYRGLNPWQNEDYRLLTFLAKGENAINGFRNHDLRKWFYPESEKADKAGQKKYSGRTTRRIKLLRVHGLIRKVPNANRYVLTEKGQKFSGALLTASTLDIKALTEKAARKTRRKNKELEDCSTDTRKFKSEKVKGKVVVSPAAMLFNSQPRTVMPRYTFDYGSLRANYTKEKK
jgi:hypothetical protein